MGLDGKTTQEVFIAALLHEIGKIGFSDALLAIPVIQIAGESPHAIRKHPVRAEQLLTPLGELRGAATIVRSHMERYDGAGFPDALVGDAIPLGTRIIGQVRDFEEKNARSCASGNDASASSVNQLGHAVRVEIVPVAVGDAAVGALDLFGAEPAQHR